MLSACQTLRCWLTCLGQGVNIKVQRNNAQAILFFTNQWRLLQCVVCAWTYSSSSVVICLLHACAAQQGSPGRTEPHGWVRGSPTIHSYALSPPLTPSRLVRPSSLPYDLPIRAADVPSAQWWPFPFTQSQSCCVTDRIGAPKQLGRKKKIPTWESYAMGGMSKNSKKTMNHPII